MGGFKSTRLGYVLMEGCKPEVRILGDICTSDDLVEC